MGYVSFGEGNKNTMAFLHRISRIGQTSSSTDRGEGFDREGATHLAPIDPRTRPGPKLRCSGESIWLPGFCLFFRCFVSLPDPGFCVFFWIFCFNPSPKDVYMICVVCRCPLSETWLKNKTWKTFLGDVFD